ncbi:Succinate dehydrogenase assembly factor 4, mitochondrial [Daldinia childiae]|uniref:Succinate dehydrogenase assembly factor 4, mitochondrial n=1 Tax=Daldinia childiae TaxID=326645 RepID=UPI001444A534|nr:Succinate dehydrogenase assembly factor 4, mitochondrial [Daldinia childiae]KAF3070495.1 Succinate dehydrogenase assembly factor 4, mitochondrial [Daldinia childiae]
MASRLIYLTRLTRSFTHTHPQPYLLSLQHHRHASNNSNSNPNPNPFQFTPSPPRLPPDEQAEFERLQRTANTQEGFNPTSTPDFSSPIASNPSTTAAAAAATPAVEDDLPSIPLRKGAPPEFEGDVNPKTGEVGGPKNEPLRWGPAGDYSFNGRVTDF